MGATSEAGTAYPSGASESTPVFSGVHVTRSLALCVSFVDRCLSFCPFSRGHLLSVLLLFTNSDYPFGIFTLLLQVTNHCYLNLSLNNYRTNYMIEIMN